jgi:branched-chain amino acid transport system ATP-binding protein
MPLLELKAVSVGYGRNRVLQNVNLTLERGEIVTLLGANGAGKSTLVKSISGLLHAEAGSILLAGEPIEALPPAERLRRGIAHVPEGRQIFAGMTVAENLALGAYASPDADITERLEFVWTLFPILRDRMQDIAGNFSGGQQQMLAIARGLMSKPKILLLDEPSLGVAPLLVAEIFRLIVSLRAQGITILLAEQNARQALSIADRGYVFENGRITLSGASKDLLNSPDVAERYLGMGSATEVSGAASAALAGRLRDVVFPDAAPAGSGTSTYNHPDRIEQWPLSG